MSRRRVGCIESLVPAPKGRNAIASALARSLHGSIRHALALPVFALFIGLCGCSGAPVIDSFARDYRDTQASVGDAQLLLNILRARDDLPLHFTDLSTISGSLQWTAGATAALPLAQNGTMTPATLSPTVGAQNTPTFTLGTLDTQDFTRGMLAPIDPQLIKQLFDQGVDPRLLMILFFSEYRDHYGNVYQNNMSCDLSHPLKNGECLNRIYGFLHEIDKIFYEHNLAPAFGTIPRAASNQPQHLYLNVYVALTPVGDELPGPWTLNNLDQLRNLDPAKYRLIDEREARRAGAPPDERTPSYKRLFSVSAPRLALCYERNGRLEPLILPSNLPGRLACTNKEIVLHESPSENDSLAIRSAYQILQFLGQVLRFQQEKRENRCLVLGADQRFCDTGEVVFQVNSPVGAPVVTTRYADGANYTVNYRACKKEAAEPCDYSLQVLAILELILNYNKAAKDIIAIPRVQIVP
jgi:hypothetical protein